MLFLFLNKISKGHSFLNVTTLIIKSETSLIGTNNERSLFALEIRNTSEFLKVHCEGILLMWTKITEECFSALFSPCHEKMKAVLKANKHIKRNRNKAVCESIIDHFGAAL